ALVIKPCACLLPHSLPAFADRRTSPARPSPLRSKSLPLGHFNVYGEHVLPPNLATGVHCFPLNFHPQSQVVRLVFILPTLLSFSPRFSENSGVIDGNFHRWFLLQNLRH